MNEDSYLTLMFEVFSEKQLHFLHSSRPFFLNLIFIFGHFSIATARLNNFGILQRAELI